MGIDKFRRKVVAPLAQLGTTSNLAGTSTYTFVPIVVDWVKETTSELSDNTVSLSSYIATNAVAVAVVLRLQDDAFKSYSTLAPKASVSTNAAALVKAQVVASDSLAVQVQGILPVDSSRELLWTVDDSKGSSVQTCSVGVLGYYC